MENFSKREIIIKGAGAIASASFLPATAPATANAQTANAQTTSRAGHCLVAAALGTYEGRSENGVRRFLGIPYCDFSANRRFEAPMPARAFNGTYAALEFGAISPQPSRAEGQGENCQCLNIWTPSSSRQPLPVLVYIHGGAYTNGSGASSLTDGTNLAGTHNVVVVTLNHRLGLFGYAYFGQLGVPENWAKSGNNGQLDLIEALKWVRDNIAPFGGDPNNITLAGQSGGGGKIATLMAMPTARGLFHKAWTMSGQQITASGPLNATMRTQAMLDHLNIAPNNLSALANLPFAELLAGANVHDPILSSGNIYFGPVLDQISLLRHPFYPDAAPQGRTIPMVLGNTLDETRAFLGGNAENFRLNWANLPAALAPQLRIDIEPNHVVATYRAAMENASPSEIFFAATTAGRSWRGQIIEAEERAKVGAPTYVYQVNHRLAMANPPAGLTAAENTPAAPHTIDIGLMFSTMDSPDSAVRVAQTQAAATAQVVADYQARLLAFMRTGRVQARGLPHWPQYDLTNRATLLVEGPQRIEKDPRGFARRLFEAVPYIQPGS